MIAYHHMPTNYFCNTCNDAGRLGFINPAGWLAGEIGDCWPFTLLLKRACIKCGGDPKSLMPKRPSTVPSSPPPPPIKSLPQIRIGEKVQIVKGHTKLDAMIHGFEFDVQCEQRPIFGMRPRVDVRIVCSGSIDE